MVVLTLVLAALLAQSAQSPISFDVKDLDLRDFLMTMGHMANVNIVVHPAIQQKITLEVRDVSWDTLLDVVTKNYGLSREAQGNVIRIVPTSVIEQEYRQQAAVEEARVRALPLETRTYVLRYAKAADVAQIISRFLSSRGSILVDARRNALIVTDIARDNLPK